ncbi:MAG: alpha/beta fold hydrolase [Halieaceae bacterium]
MRRRDDLIGTTLCSVLAALWLIASPLASAVAIDGWLSETHDGALHAADLGECVLENSQVIEACRLTFRTYGRLAPDLSNIVLMPTWLNGNAEGLATYNYLGPEGIVDTDDYFVIAVNALGNGVSSSPSNSAQLPFPAFTIRDQVSLQHRLLTEYLDIEHLHAVVGASMGGYQTYEWLMMYPDFATHYVPIEGTPWYTFYDQLKGRAWQEVLALPEDSPEAIQRKAHLLALIDGMVFWTPEYLNRERSMEQFDEWLAGMARFDNAPAIADRASQNASTAQHDIRRGRPDFEARLEAMGRPSVLAVVFERDMTVNPEPNKTFAKQLGFEVVEIPGDCGHFGSNPECYQEQVVERVSAFLRGPDKAQFQRRTMTIGAKSRQYYVYLPEAYGSRPLPVVMALHGYGTTATGLASAHEINPHANANDYIVVYPQGAGFYSKVAWQSGDDLVSSWNDLASNVPTEAGPHCLPDRLDYPCYPECGDCKACDWTSCEDDVGFLLSITQAVKESLLVDPDRFYLLGNSNGGSMVQRLGCDYPEHFAAVGIMIYQMPPGHACGPSETLPMFHYYGELDDGVPPDGEPSSDGWVYTSAADNTRIWAETMGCSGPAVPWQTLLTQEHDLQCEAYTDCLGEGVAVVSCGDPRAGHEWAAQRIDAIPADCVAPAQQQDLPRQPICPAISPAEERWGMELVWQFLSQYSRSPALAGTR